MTELPPIAGGRLWHQVIDRAAGVCQCEGACGRRHARTGGRCTVGQAAFQPVPLYVAPSDPTVPTDQAWRLRHDQLAAWCGQCLDDARPRHRTTPRAPVTETGDLFALLDPGTPSHTPSTTGGRPCPPRPSLPPLPTS